MNTQPTALRLADALNASNSNGKMCDEAAAELRRLHQTEREGWRYADELEKERKRLERVNQELMEALVECERYGKGYTNRKESYLPPFVRSKIQTALAKARGTE